MEIDGNLVSAAAEDYKGSSGNRAANDNFNHQKVGMEIQAIGEIVDRFGEIRDKVVSVTSTKEDN